MKKLQIYVDTSVLGGCFEPEFAPWSNGLLADFRAGTFTPVLSALLETELRRAPEPIREVYRELLGLAGESVPVGDEALDLLAATRHAECSVLSFALICSTSSWLQWPTLMCW